jgi:perosamine synthetase
LNFFHTHISPGAILLAERTLRSGFVSEGRIVGEFERMLETELGLHNAVAVNSGTSALHLALVVAGVGAGDEVVIPAQTFVATGLSVLMSGARPVFCDIQRDTGNMSPESFASRVTERTKAVIPVHWAGLPCDMDEIARVATGHGIVVIEDAAHALGATYKHRPVGALSRFTAFSFQAIKHLTTGDGGALCCETAADLEEARRLRWFGIDRVRDSASFLGERQYNLRRIGFKYHLNDLAASVGLGNLPDVRKNIGRHREIASIYGRELANLAGLAQLRQHDDRESSCWIWTALFERRDDFIRAMTARDVPVSVVHQRIDRNSVFGRVNTDLPNQSYFDDHQAALPVHIGLTDDDVASVVRAVRAGW